MRENRTYGSEGGAARVITGRAYPYQGATVSAFPPSTSSLDLSTFEGRSPAPPHTSRH